MKIYYIVSSFDGGGAEFVIPDLINLFKKLGHSVELFGCIPRNMETVDLLKKSNISYRLLSGNNEYRYKSTFHFNQIVKRSPPDVIWTSLTRATVDGQLVGLWNRIPVVSWKHSANSYSLRLIKTILMQRLSRLWIADSTGVANFLKSKMKVPENRIKIWSLFKIPHNLPMGSVWNGKGIFHIGSVGRLHTVKNFPLMIRAMAYINHHYPEVGKRIKLSIAGSGKEERHLKNLIHLLKVDNVELIGFSDDVMNFLSKLHLYLQTSVYEGLCIAVHEALAVGIPVISTNVGEMRSAFRNNSIGTLIDKNSPELLARQILEYYHNPSKTQYYAANARQYMQQHYSEESFEASGRFILNHIEENILPRYLK